MGPATRKAALAKLGRISGKIGYPEHWRDYSSLRIVRGDALGNAYRSREFELQRQLSKIGRPVDRAEWSGSASVANAYYDPQLNSITFPAAILQPPLFDRQADDAANFAAIGAIIGHELTHGFDDQAGNSTATVTSTTGGRPTTAKNMSGERNVSPTNPPGLKRLRVSS